MIEIQNRRLSADERRLTREDCIARMTQALALASAAPTPESRAEYAEIADMWEAMAGSMQRHGLNGLAALRREQHDRVHTGR